MAYGTLAAIKEILRISDTKSDTELTNCQASAYAQVNNILKFHGFTIPLSSPNQNLIDAENYWAAAFFREREDSTAAEKWYKRGQAFLQDFIQAEKYEITFLKA